MSEYSHQADCDAGAYPVRARLAAVLSDRFRLDARPRYNGALAPENVTEGRKRAIRRATNGGDPAPGRRA